MFILLPSVTNYKAVVTLCQSQKWIIHNFKKKHMKLSAYIIDDEPIYINILRKIISNSFSQIEVVGHSTNLDDALDSVNQLNPDILFLDVNIGNREIFDVLHSLHTNSHLIFISSDQKYALNAFRYDAVDFMLKPIVKDICVSAINKAINKIESNKSFLNQDFFFNNDWTRNFISISFMDRLEIIHVDEILFCNAEGRYTRFRLKDGRQLVSSKNLAEYNTFFSLHACFLRVSRSSVVNFKFISKVVKKDGMHCVFNDGSIVSVARRKYNELNKFLNTLGVKHI